MIFWGSKGKTLPGQVVEGIQCPNCENKQFITFGILRYFHLYWVPTFVTSKTVGIECTHCKKTLVGKEIPQELGQKIKATVFNTKNTLPMFSGLLLMACLALFVTYTVQQSNIKESEYIEQPAINDLYSVNFNKIFPDDIDPKYMYGVMRIKNISAGQVEFQVSEIAYNKKSGVSKDIRKEKTSADTYYTNKSMFIEFKKLKSMKDSGAIYSIDRI